MKTVAVVGAGIVGRTCALALARNRYGVTLFDRGDFAARGSVSFVAAGMLAPISEAVAGERAIYELGKDAVRRWKELIATLPAPVGFWDQGSLIAARAADLGEIDATQARIRRLDPDADVRLLDRRELGDLEPDLDETLAGALLIGGEGAVHAWQAMEALAAALSAHERVTLRLGEEADVQAFRVGREEFDVVVDCRGLGARGHLSDLRGVRGELVEIEAPEVRITRPTRVPHARYPVYVVPRGGGKYVIGATCLESEDDGAPTVTSVLELLGAAYALGAGFRVARVTRHAAGVRPAFFDNLPRVSVESGLVRVNGLFRHGFLLAPAMSAQVVESIA